MGRRGPAPKPTALKILAGNPGKRKLNKNELRFPAGAPPCPEFVLKDKFAHAEWKRVVPELLRMGVLSEIFGTALAAYCMSFSQWQRAEEILRKEGHTYTMRNGTVCTHPAMGIARQAMAATRVWAAEFGMTPASSSRLNITMPDEEEEEKARRFFGES